MWNLQQPLNKIRSYFGEKIALYFAYLSFYTTFLCILVPIGVATSIISFHYDSSDPVAMISNCCYCIIVVFWCFTFTQYWRRYEAKLAIRWGQMNYEEA